MVVARGIHGILHDDGRDKVHEHEAGKGDVGVEVHPREGHIHQNWAHVGVEGVLAQNLHKRVHDLVDAVQDIDDGVELFELSTIRDPHARGLQGHGDQEQASNPEGVRDKENHDDRPAQGPHRVLQTSNQLPSLAEEWNLAEDAHQANDAHCTQQRERAETRLVAVVVNYQEEQRHNPSDHDTSQDNEGGIHEVSPSITARNRPIILPAMHFQPK
mmetsp:Transcript_145417/g.465932  ORF Transcript_145417/g.465932 Transcript_145417/m.465932 type:complete len:215 (-) Transcript_145417:1435-2079(-)